MERVEEYIEAIYDIQKAGKVARTKEIADKLNIKPSSVTEMLNKLNEMGFVEYQPYKGAILTKRGIYVAEKIKKRYNVFKRFFTDFLGLDEEYADELSCKLEHVADERVINRVCKIISGSCEVCDECEEEIYSLSDCREGRYSVIVSPAFLKESGIIPGRVIEVLEDKIVIDGEEILIDEEIKRKVFVKRL